MNAKGVYLTIDDFSTPFDRKCRNVLSCDTLSYNKFFSKSVSVL